jgi:hypothetical protein
MLARHKKSHGQIIDEVIINTRRLAFAHVALGIASAFNFLSREGILHPSLRAITSFRGGSIDVIAHAMLAWAPYIASWTISRAMLSGRNTGATLLFIAFAIAITILSFERQFPVTGAFNISALVLSSLLTLSLATACGICAIIWHRDA